MKDYLLSKTKEQRSLMLLKINDITAVYLAIGSLFFCVFAQFLIDYIKILGYMAIVWGIIGVPLGIVYVWFHVALYSIDG